MRIILIPCLLLVHASCFDATTNDSKTKRLNERIDRVEERIDSLGNVSRNVVKNEDQKSVYGSGMLQRGSSCQAITKKGKHCSRKARSNSYCWQHGG